MVAGPTYIRRCCALRSVSAFSVVRPRPYSAILQPGADLPWQTTCTCLFCLIFHMQCKTTGVYDCQKLAFPLSMLFSGDFLYCGDAGADRCNRGPPLQPGMSKVRRWSTAVTQGPSDHAAKLSIIGLDTVILRRMTRPSWWDSWAAPVLLHNGCGCTCKWLLTMCTAVLFAPTSHNFFST